MDGPGYLPGLSEISEIIQTEKSTSFIIFIWNLKKNKTKRQPTELEKIFVNCIFDQGLISKELLQLSIKKQTKASIKIWAEDLNRRFPKEDTQIRRRESCSMVTDHQGHADQNHCEASPRPVRSALIKKRKQQMSRKGNPCAVLVGM